MFRNVIWALAALSLMGCPSGNPHTDDTDTGTDTDTDNPSEMARLTVNVTLLGEPEPCFVRLDGEQIGPSGGDGIEVPADSYTLTVGSNEMTADGLPIHRDAENAPWVAVPIDITLVANGSKTEDVPLNRYFNGAFNCVQENYAYDENAPDFKGDFDDTYYWNEVTLNVEDGHRIQTNDQMLTFTNTDVLIIGGNQIVDLETTTATTLSNGHISTGENGDTVLTMTVVNNEFGFVSDVTCEEE